MSGNSFKLLMKCPPSSVAAPTNTVAPSIGGTAQVGSTLSGNDGTWTGSPTYSRQWKADGANIAGATGTTYVPTAGDVGKVITFSVTANNAGGSAVATSSATSAVIAASTKALRNVSTPFGCYTPAGKGHVWLKNLMIPTGNDIPVSWTIAAASVGTNSHFTRPAAGVTEASGTAWTPYLSATGDGADMSDLIYTWSVTATYSDNSTDTKTLTYTREADAISMGQNEQILNNVFEPATVMGGMSLATFLALNGGSPKSLLISRGTYRPAIRSGLGSFTFASQVRVRHADPANPSIFSNFDINGCTFIKLENMVTVGDQNWTGTIGPNVILGLTDSADVVLQDCGVDGGSMANYGPQVPNGPFNQLYGLSLRGTNSRITVNNLSIQHCWGGINELTGATSTDVTFNNYFCRYFGDNAVFLGNATNFTFNDPCTASPIRSPGSGAHIDHWQGQDSTSVTNLVVNRLVIIDADGDAYSGGFFGLGGTMTINGYIHLNRGNQGMTLSGSSGANTIKNFTLLKGYGVNVNTDPTTGIDDSNFINQDPGITIRNSDTGWGVGSTSISSGIIQDQIAYVNSAGGTGGKPSSITIAPSVHALNIHTAPGGAGASAFTPYFASDPRVPYNAKTDAQWKAMNAADLISFAKSIATPKAGVTDGALADTGAWNT